MESFYGLYSPDDAINFFVQENINVPNRADISPLFRPHNNSPLTFRPITAFSMTTPSPTKKSGLSSLLAANDGYSSVSLPLPDSAKINGPSPITVISGPSPPCLGFTRPLQFRETERFLERSAPIAIPSKKSPPQYAETLLRHHPSSF